MIGVFIEYEIPSIEEFLDDIFKLNYPKEKISLFICNAVMEVQYFNYSLTSDSTLRF